MKKDDTKILKSGFRGAILGSAIGDAVGELAFHCMSRNSLEEAADTQEILTYTDDTAMMIGLAESLIQDGDVYPESLGKIFHRHYDEEPWRGYAGGPPRIFSSVAAKRCLYTDSAQSLYGGKGSFGNGAAMRVVPIGLVYRNDEKLYEKVRKSALPTHAHPVGIDGAALIAKSVAWAVACRYREDTLAHDLFDILMPFCRTETIRKRLEQASTMIVRKESEAMAGFALGSGVEAQNSVGFALFAFLSHPDSFEDCLYSAALNSTDRDTVACMACAISGAYLGIEALPQKWREKIENEEYLVELADSLLDVC